MGDEERHVLPVRHLAREWRGCVQHDQRRVGADLPDDLMRDLSDQPVRHRHENDIRLAQRRVHVNAIRADRAL